MMLNKRERNNIYERIVESKLDPAEFDLEDTGSKVVIRHNSGSTFEFSLNPAIGDRSLIGKIQASRYKYHKYEYRANVAEGINQAGTTDSISSLGHEISYWLSEILLTVGVPDYWAELKRSRELIIDIEQIDSGNTPFTKEEQGQIAAQLQEITEQLKEQFALTANQVEQVGERLDEAVEASKRMGRKDWLLLLGGTIFNLIVTDTVTPGVAGHIFTMVIHGIAHLFTGGPPQILA